VIAIFTTADSSIVVGLVTLVGLIFNTLWSRRAAGKAAEAVRQAQTTNILARETAQQVQTPNGETLGDTAKLTSDLALRTASTVERIRGQVGDLGAHLVNMSGKLAQVEDQMTEHIKRQEPLEARFLEEHPDLRPKED